MCERECVCVCLCVCVWERERERERERDRQTDRQRERQMNRRFGRGREQGMMAEGMNLCEGERARGRCTYISHIFLVQNHMIMPCVQTWSYPTEVCNKISDWWLPTHICVFLSTTHLLNAPPVLLIQKQNGLTGYCFCTKVDPLGPCERKWDQRHAWRLSSASVID